MNKKNPSGNAFLNSEYILNRAGIAAGFKVADLGCGAGYFVLQAARMVGDQGVVYAVDVLKDALSSVSSKARMYGLSNVMEVWDDVEVYGGTSEIKNESLDLVLLVQLLCQSKKHGEIFNEVNRIIKPRGTVLVVDWGKNKIGFGPAEQDRVSVLVVKDLANRINLKFVEEFKAGPYHFGLIFEKK